VNEFVDSVPCSVRMNLKPHDAPPLDASPGSEIYTFLSNRSDGPRTALSLVGPRETELSADACWAVIRLLAQRVTSARLVEEEDLLRLFSRFHGTPPDVRVAAQEEADRIKEHPIVLIMGAMGRGDRLSPSLRDTYGSWLRFRLQEGRKTVFISRQQLRLGQYISERMGTLWAELGTTVVPRG
jgi:hypothetical protein